MIRSIGVAALFLGLAVAPVAAQSAADSLILHYANLKKVQIAARACTSEEGRLQVARNEHYDAVLRANTEVAGAPTLSEISAALLETRLEDGALQKKREECELILDEVVGAARELRRDCVAYPITPATNEEPSRSETAAIDICRAATDSAAYASANRNPQ